jgi:hypothetical protein
MNYGAIKRLLLALVSAGFFLGNAGAAPLFYDGFDYTPPGTFLAPVTDTTASPNPGLLNVASGWNWRYAGAGSAAVNNAPAIAGVGLNFNDVTGYSGFQPTPGNSVLFDMTQIGSARIQVTPAAISSGTVYWSGLLQVGNIANLNTVNGMILGGLVTSADAGTLPGTVGAVLRIRQDTFDSAVFHIGIGMNSGTATTGAGGPNVQFANSLNFAAGQTVFVVAAYEFVAGATNDIARMWINPNPADFTLESPPPATLTAAPGFNVADSSASVLAFNLRNVNTVGTPTGVLFDELRFGTSWADVMPAVPEPTAAGLMGFGLLAISCYRLRPR